MVEVAKPVRLYRAHQILIDISTAEYPTFNIEAYDGPVMVSMERSVLEEFFRQAEPIRLGLLKSPERFEEG